MVESGFQTFLLKLKHAAQKNYGRALAVSSLTIAVRLALAFILFALYIPVAYPHGTRPANEASYLFAVPVAAVILSCLPTWLLIRIHHSKTGIWREQLSDKVRTNLVDKGLLLHHMSVRVDIEQIRLEPLLAGTLTGIHIGRDNSAQDRILQLGKNYAAFCRSIGLAPLPESPAYPRNVATLSLIPITLAAGDIFSTSLPSPDALVVLGLGIVTRAVMHAVFPSSFANKAVIDSVIHSEVSEILSCDQLSAMTRESYGQAG